MSLELLALGANFLGGLFGQSKADKQHRRQLQLSQKQFDAQMDESVQRRVADAKKAGIHPLFALGGSVGASPTMHVGGGEGGGPMQSAIEGMARSLGVIEQNRASAKRDEAEAALLDSERARIDQDLRSRGADGVKTFAYGENPTAVIGPPEYFKPEVPYSKEMGVQAGTQPGTVELVMPDGQVIKSYRQELGLDEIGQVVFAGQRIPYVLAKTFGKMQLKALTGRWPTDAEWAKFRKRVKEMK